MNKKASEIWGLDRWQGKVALFVESVQPGIEPAQVWLLIEALDALRDDIVEVVYRECSNRNTDEE